MEEKALDIADESRKDQYQDEWSQQLAIADCYCYSRRVGPHQG